MHALGSPPRPKVTVKLSTTPRRGGGGDTSFPALLRRVAAPTPQHSAQPQPSTRTVAALTLHSQVALCAVKRGASRGGGARE